MFQAFLFVSIIALGPDMYDNINWILYYNDNWIAISPYFSSFHVLESILPNFHFSDFPIFAGKLEGLLHMEKNASSIKWPSLSAKNGKILCLRRKKVW